MNSKFVKATLILSLVFVSLMCIAQMYSYSILFSTLKQVKLANIIQFLPLATILLGVLFDFALIGITTAAIVTVFSGKKGSVVKAALWFGIIINTAAVLKCGFSLMTLMTRAGNIDQSLSTAVGHLHTVAAATGVRGLISISLIIMMIISLAAISAEERE